MSDSRRPIVLAFVALVAGAVLLTGCGRVQDAAENRVDEAVDSATARAGDAVEGKISEQAQTLLDESLDQVDTPCSEFTARSAAEQAAAGAAVLQAFWLVQLYTEPAEADVTDRYTAALTEQCGASGESRLADVARAVYDTGEYAPPQ